MLPPTVALQIGHHLAPVLVSLRGHRSTHSDTIPLLLLRDFLDVFILFHGTNGREGIKRSCACFLTLTFTGLTKLNVRIYKREDERSNETPPRRSAPPSEWSRRLKHGVTLCHCCTSLVSHKLLRNHKNWFSGGLNTASRRRSCRKAAGAIFKQELEVTVFVWNVLY